MRDAEPLELEAARAELVEAAMGELFLRFPPLAGYSQTQLARTRRTSATSSSFWRRRC